MDINIDYLLVQLLPNIIPTINWHTVNHMAPENYFFV
jgi:hypothetical protein